ncbi:hypothetical protein Ct9H90mP29_13550 [bacterium]|nr:MAG: hypothetical protein Ct9H90mP29_13550 [bacterium]
MAGDLKSISADHLMAVSDEGIEALKRNEVIATLLPGTTFFLGKTSYAPYKKLKHAGVDIALATDYKPWKLSYPINVIYIIFGLYLYEHGYYECN